MKIFLLSRQTVKYLLGLLCLSILLIGFSVQKVSAQEEEQEKDPIAIFNKGQDAHEKGNLLEALKLYDEALAAAPEFPEAEFQRAAALESLNRFTEAEKSFRQALQLRPGWIAPQVALAKLLIKTKKFSEAELLLEAAQKAAPNDSSIFPLLSDLYILAQSPAEKIKNLLSRINILTAQNSDSSLLAARGALESALGEKTAARKSLLAAIAVDSKNIFALRELAEISISEKNYSAALPFAQKLVALDKSSTASNVLLARILALGGNLAEAVRILDSLDAADAEVSTLKNSIFISSEENTATLEKQLAADAKNTALLARLCVLTRQTPAKALEYCRRAAEAEPQNISHAVGFAAALVQARQFPAAIDLLQRLLVIDADNYTIHANLATALFESKNYAAAKDQYKWLIAVKPELAVAYYFLAIAHDNLREYKEALNNYQNFLRLADTTQNRLEIEKVNLRLPTLEKQIKSKN